MKMVEIIVMVLLIIGGINWGLVGAFDMDVVAMIFGAGSMMARVVYLAVGVSALYQIYHMFTHHIE